MNFANNFIIYLLRFIPKWAVKIIANRYIAGTSINHAIKAIKKINSKNQSATLDILGEHTKDIESSSQITNEYIEILRQIQINNLDCNVSIKPTHIGSDINEDTVMNNFKKIQSYAIKTNNFVRLDMESSKITDLTLNIYKKLMKINGNSGIVVQAYLYRSENDIESLPDNINIRLCKGIYNEDESIAIKDQDEINKNYIKLLSMIFKKKIYVGIATHDKKLIKDCMELIENQKIPTDKFEFQYLYGVPMNDMIKLYIENNFKVRAYIPFGLDWYNYSIRRIKENPKIATYIIKNLFKFKV